LTDVNAAEKSPNLFICAGNDSLYCKSCPMTESLLQVVNLAKRFDGIVATDNLTLNVAAGELHAVIGPNGAGKTTLIAQLGGQVMPDSGRIRFAGNDITALPVHRRSHLGLARTFQISSLFLDLTVLDNVAMAVQAHAGHSFRFWRNARKDLELRQPARAVLTRVGLAERADVAASALSHGEHRLLELAVALASQPRILLLDEPMAGLGPEESARMVSMLRALKSDVTILLVEHDMEAVFALADRITVLVYGRVIASGAPDTIRASEEVRQAYLGEADEGNTAIR
jgi:branched-chain amino acid transport system ATP-binding protein